MNQQELDIMGFVQLIIYMYFLEKNDVLGHHHVFDKRIS